MYSDKATKFWEIFTLLLSYVVPVKSKVKISQNFVAFSEYMNFNIQQLFYWPIKWQLCVCLWMINIYIWCTYWCKTWEKIITRSCALFDLFCCQLPVNLCYVDCKKQTTYYKMYRVDMETFAEKKKYVWNYLFRISPFIIAKYFPM